MNAALKESTIKYVTQIELAEECLSSEESRKQILDMVHEHYHDS